MGYYLLPDQRNLMYEYRAVVVRWKDGDTLVAHIDQGFHDWKHDQSLRLFGIDAPDKPAVDKEAARAYCDNKWPAGTELTVQTIRDKKGSEVTTFERWLAEAWGEDDDLSISALIIDAGYGKPWNGKGPHP
jgi:endonuclease YncB( thermonuclease family)